MPLSLKERYILELPHTLFKIYFIIHTEPVVTYMSRQKTFTLKGLMTASHA